MASILTMHSTGTRCGNYYVGITIIYIVNAVFLTMFMMANLFDIYEIDDEIDDELKPLKLEAEATERQDESSYQESPVPSGPSPLAKDLYLSSMGR